MPTTDDFHCPGAPHLLTIETTDDPLLQAHLDADSLEAMYEHLLERCEERCGREICRAIGRRLTLGVQIPTADLFLRMLRNHLTVSNGFLRPLCREFAEILAARYASAHPSEVQRPFVTTPTHESASHHESPSRTDDRHYDLDRSLVSRRERAAAAAS